MQHQKAFATVQQAASFASECFHFKYKHAYIELCAEGNVYENAHCHMMRYFANIDVPEPSCLNALNNCQCQTRWCQVAKLLPVLLS